MTYHPVGLLPCRDIKSSGRRNQMLSSAEMRNSFVQIADSAESELASAIPISAPALDQLQQRGVRAQTGGTSYSYEHENHSAEDQGIE
jgi:hypothetical protein